MDAFIGAVRALSRASGVVSVLLLFAAVLAVNHLVILRYVLNASAIWQYEFVTYSLIGATIIGSPYVLMTRGHVTVDLLPLYLGPRLRFALALFAAIHGPRLLPGAGRDRLRLLAPGLVEGLGLGDGVGAAVVDPVPHRAARHGASRAAIPGRHPGARHRARAAVRHA